MVTGGGLADAWPLTPAQEGLLYHALFDTNGPDVYVVQCRFRVEPPVDGPALRSAVTRLLDRHPGLRACFRHRGLDRPVQVVPRRVTVPWREVDLAADGESLARLLAADRGRRFDVTRPPLVRGTLVRHEGGAGELILTLHHLLVDGWSMPILTRDLNALYTGADLPPAPPFRDYLAWLRRQDGAAAAGAWRAALDGVQRPTLVAGAAPARPPMVPEAVERALPERLSAAVRQGARRAGVTVSTVVQAAWGLVLARMTGSDDVVFGAVVSGRPPDLPGAEDMVGLLVNTVPVRVRLRRGERAGQLLTRLRDEQLRLMPHHHVRTADLSRLAGDVALPDTVLAFENFPGGGDAPAGPGPLRLTGVHDASHHPLTLVVAPGERLWLRLQYRPDCFDRAAAERVAARLECALGQLAGEPDAAVEHLDVLPAAERELLLHTYQGRTRTVAPGTIVDRFAGQARRTPDACAVGALSYAELADRAGRLAGALAEAGAAPGDTVAIVLPRCTDLVVAQLAVLTAGACYVPLDAEPASRLDWLLRDSGARLVLTDQPARPWPDGIRAVPVTAAGTPAPVPVSPSSAACVMYTSGSTGTPKGVVVTHRNVVELAADRGFAGGAHARVLWQSPHTFDAVTYELWVPLLTGGTVVVAPPGRLEPATLRTVLTDGQVTAMCLTPELLRVVLDLAPDALAGLREVWPAGDVVAPELVRRTLAAGPGAVVVNGYGPTETTTFATTHPLRAPLRHDLASVPIGRPLDNTGTYVLDRRLRPVPVGAVGELYLSGTGVTRGYLNQPARTAERFVAAPFARPGERMYRTGDLVRWTGDGTLEFAGRADEQLKVRGFRIEPGEIETVLEELRDVRRAVVAAVPGLDGGRRVIAYLVPEPGLDLDDVRRHVLHRLPAHLRPDGYHRLARIPVNRHGKVDRTALPQPAREPTGPAVAASPRAEALCRAFATVLRRPAVASGDNFFEAGGDSLTAMRLTAEIETTLGLRVPISLVFDAPTPAALAERLDGNLRDLGTAPLLTLRAGGAATPLFCVHPAMGLGWSYTALLPHLPGGRPIHALQSPAVHGDTALPESMEQLAAEYVERIRAVQPRGPYALLGRSFGGPLGYEMAVRLRRAGQEVGLLAVLDAVAPWSAGEPAELDPGLIERESLRILLQALPPHAPPPTRLTRAGVFAAVRAGGVLRGASEQRLTALVDVCARHISLVQRYRPPAFDGRVVLFSATAQPNGRTSAAKVAAWRRTAAAVELHEVDCTHSETLTPGPAARIAAVLGPLLAEV